MAELSGKISLRPTTKAQTGIGSTDSFSSLQEPVEETIRRDLGKVWTKLKLVLLPQGDQSADVRDWDLWGPLFLCLLLALTLSLDASPNVDQQESATLVFAQVFVVVWVGAAVVTLNAQLLGASISFFQSVCVVGYCLCPLNLAALAVVLLAGHLALVKLGCVGFACFWSTRAAAGFVTQLVQERRRRLALYPVLLFYVFLGWFILIL